MSDFEAMIQIYASNIIGVLASVSRVLADMKVLILQVNTQQAGKDTTIINLTVSCKSTDHYQSIVSRLRTVSGVLSVSRGFC